MMDLGMLWYDDDKTRPLAAKVARAVDFYRAKYGEQPTVCYAHKLTLGADAPAAVGVVKLRADGAVVAGNFWIGVERFALPLAAPEPAAAGGSGT